MEGDDVPCEIEKGLYLGSVKAANNKIALKSLNVTHVLTVAHRLPAVYPADFTYKIIPVPDLERVNIAQYFVECFVFIEEAKRNGGGVLVHCIAGVSRSTTIVLAYLIIKHGMSLDEAMEHVKKKRPVIFPNYGFRTQLENLEKSLRDRWFRFTFRVAVARRRMTEALLHRARYLRRLAILFKMVGTTERTKEMPGKTACHLYCSPFQSLKLQQKGRRSYILMG